MEKNRNQFTEFSEIDGLDEYNEFTRLVEESKEFIKELQDRAFQERKTGVAVQTEDGFEICAFKKNLSPLFVGMVQLATTLISQNVKSICDLVSNHQDNKTTITFTPRELGMIFQGLDCLDEKLEKANSKIERPEEKLNIQPVLSIRQKLEPIVKARARFLSNWNDGDEVRVL